MEPGNVVRGFAKQLALYSRLTPAKYLGLGTKQGVFLDLETGL